MRKLLFFILIFFLPTQLGLHFWPEFSKVAGFKVDYLSPAVYLFDLLLLLNFLLVRNKSFLKLPKMLYLACLINLVYVKFSPIALYGWFRIFEYSFFLKYLLTTPNLIKKTLLPFYLVTFLICLLALLQFLTQHSIQGPFYFLGERFFDSTTPHLGTLNFKLFTLDFRFIRPSSIFPHANVLAGFLLLAILLSKQLRFGPILKRLLVLTLLLTFSKTAIFTYFLVFVLNTSLLQNFLISLTFSFLPFLDINLITLNTRRFILYTLTQFKIQDFFFGIGPKAFITKLPYLYPASNINSATLQPLHNLFSLILLELGLLPILVVILNLIQDRSRNPLRSEASEFGMTKTMCNLFAILLLTGSLDHYWWTLPQATLSFILVFVLLFRYGVRPNNHSH